jgi:hypothetical protein
MVGTEKWMRDRLKVGNKVARALLSAVNETVLLVVLAMGVPLRAQSSLEFSFSKQSTVSDSIEYSERVTPSPYFLQPDFPELCPWISLCDYTLLPSEPSMPLVAPHLESTISGEEPDKDSESSSDSKLRTVQPTDPNRSIYYKNKLEFGLDVGWLPINIPFVFDFLLGDGYNVTGLNYTLVPVLASLRWHLDDVKGPVILRGNWDLTFSLSATAIPRGPETRYFAYIMGIRRNFVPRRWRAVPYLDGRAGLGDIDAKGPLGVRFAQGQNFTFTLNLGSGLRYNISPRYAISAGLNWMHISNLYLSQPKFLNYGINVYGPMVGIDIRVGKRRRDAAQ